MVLLGVFYELVKQRSGRVAAIFATFLFWLLLECSLRVYQ